MYNSIPNDPSILLSFINTKLRDYYKDLDELCDELDVDRAEVEAKLAIIHYQYDAENNKFI